MPLYHYRCSHPDEDQPFLEPDDAISPDDCLAMPVVLFTTNITIAKQLNEPPTLGQRVASITSCVLCDVTCDNIALDLVHLWNTSLCEFEGQ